MVSEFRNSLRIHLRNFPLDQYHLRSSNSIQVQDELLLHLYNSTLSLDLNVSISRRRMTMNRYNSIDEQFSFIIHNKIIFYNYKFNRRLLAVRYIKSVDGFSGCYRGLVPKLCAYTVSAIAFEKTSESIKFENESDKKIDEDDLSESER